MRAVFRQQIAIPVGKETFHIDGFCKLLSVAPARNGMYGIDFWYLTSDVAPAADVTISIAGTGHRLSEIETERNYVGTCVMPDGLVWHVFADVVSR